MIYSKLHPDIMCQGIKYTIFDDKNSNKDFPIIQLYDKWDGTPLLLLGEGSMGKSTAMRVLEAEILFRGAPVILIECGSISKHTNFKSVLAQSRPNTIFLIDGLDEINKRYEKKLIHFIEYITGKFKVIVSSRYNPIKGKLNEDEFDEFKIQKHKLFEKFVHSTLCAFTPEEINQIVGDYIDKDSKCFALLSNTMFMAIILSFYEGSKKDQISKFQLAEDEISFMQTYFDILFEEKERSKKADIYLRAIGHAKYKTLIGSPLTEAVDIPDELKGIFRLIKTKQGNYKIKSTQQRYENFAMAKYLFSRVLEEFNVDLNATILNRLFDYDNLNRGALVYLGNMLAKRKNGAEIMKKLNAFPKTDTTCYINLVFVFLGYRNGVLDDISVNGVFDLGVKFVDIADKHYFFAQNEHIKEINSIRLMDLNKIFAFDCCFNIVIPDSVRQLKPHAFILTGECIQDITVGKSLCKLGPWTFGGDRIRIGNIFVHPQNKAFEVRGNCLIDKKKNAVVLCGANAVVPEDIDRIESQALYSITPLRIPSSITNIGNQDGYIGINEDGSRYFISIEPADHSTQFHYYYGNSVQALLHDDICASSFMSSVTTILEQKYLFTEQDSSDDDFELLSDEPHYLTKPYNAFLRLNPTDERIQQESSNSSAHNLLSCINFEDATKNIYSRYSVGASEMKSVIGSVFKSMRSGFSEDLFLLVNGFPVVYIKAVDSKKGLEIAYAGLNEFYRTHEKEFRYTQFCVITNGSETKIGKVTDSFDDYVDYCVDNKKYIPTYLNIRSGLSTVGLAVQNLFEPSKLNGVLFALLSGWALRDSIKYNLDTFEEVYLEERKNDEERAKVYALEGDANELKIQSNSTYDDLIKKQCKVVAGSIIGIFFAVVIAFLCLNFKKIIFFAHYNMAKYLMFSAISVVAFIVVFFVLYFILSMLLIQFRMTRCVNGKGTTMIGKKPRIQMLFEIQDYLFKKGYYTYVSLDSGF